MSIHDVPYLRALRMQDAPAVLDAVDSDPEGMTRQGAVRTDLEAAGYVGRLVAPGSDAHPWAVVDERDRLVGLVVVDVDRTHLVGWFWYWMHASHRGRGLASASAAAVADWALSEGGLERLELGHRANNPASGAVARAAGFVHEGTERAKFLVDGERVDVLTYGRLRTDPWPVLPSEAAGQ